MNGFLGGFVGRGEVYVDLGKYKFQRGRERGVKTRDVTKKKKKREKTRRKRTRKRTRKEKHSWGAGGGGKGDETRIIVGIFLPGSVCVFVMGNSQPAFLMRGVTT